MSYLTLAVLLHWATAAIAPAHAGASAGAQRARPVIISTDPGGRTVLAVGNGSRVVYIYIYFGRSRGGLDVLEGVWAFGELADDQACLL